MARLKAIESRFGFRYGGVSASRPPGGGFVGGTPTLLERGGFLQLAGEGFEVCAADGRA
jgi:hypothetical protein